MSGHAVPMLTTNICLSVLQSLREFSFWLYWFCRALSQAAVIAMKRTNYWSTAEGDNCQSSGQRPLERTSLVTLEKCHNQFALGTSLFFVLPATIKIFSLHPPNFSYRNENLHFSFSSDQLCHRAKHITKHQLKKRANWAIYQIDSRRTR